MVASRWASRSGERRWPAGRPNTLVPFDDSGVIRPLKVVRGRVWPFGPEAGGLPLATRPAVGATLDQVAAASVVLEHLELPEGLVELARAVRLATHRA